MPTNKTPKEFLLRALLLMIGLTIAHFGVTLFLLSRLGADPFNVLVEGLFKTASRLTGLPFLTHGRVIVDVSFVIAGMLLGGTFGPGTLVCAALVGPVAGFFLPVSERVVRQVIDSALRK